MECQSVIRRSSQSETKLDRANYDRVFICELAWDWVMGLLRLRTPSNEFGAKSESPLKWTDGDPAVLFRELLLLARWRSLSEGYTFSSGRCWSGASPYSDSDSRFFRLPISTGKSVSLFPNGSFDILSSYFPKTNRFKFAKLPISGGKISRSNPARSSSFHLQNRARAIISSNCGSVTISSHYDNNSSVPNSMLMWLLVSIDLWLRSFA
jgi:hypothetical protein